jgi:ACS family glucarate transporter-like MFS transporter
VSSASPVASARTATNVRWAYVAPALLVATLVAQIDKTNISVVIANRPFLSDMGLLGHPALIGGLVSAFLFSYGVGLLLWGFVIDAIGPRKAAALGVFLWSLTLAWSGLSTSLTMLYASRVALGLSEGVLFPVCNAFVARWWPPRERGKAQAFWYNGNTIGIAIAGLLATGLIVANGWRVAFLIVAALNFVIVLPLIWFLTSDDPRRDRRVSAEEQAHIADPRLAMVVNAEAADMTQVARNYRYWLLVVAWIANNVFFWGWISWMPTYLMNARHFSFAASGVLTGVTYAIEVIAVFILGMLTDRFRRRGWTGAIGYLLAATGLYVGGLIPVASIGLPVMIAGLCCHQASSSNVQTLIHSFGRAEVMGRAAGILNAVGNFASAFSPALVGAMIGLHRASFSGVLLFEAIMLVVAALAQFPIAAASY